MTEKITQTKHIRQQLESLYQQKYNQLNRTKPKPVKKYQGLGLNWRDAVILILALFFVGLYQVQAQAQVQAKDCFDLDDIDTGMMLSYQEAGNNYAALKLLSSDYQIDITGIVAQVNITQTFHNDSTQWIKEGMYAFPVAKNAAVYQMRLTIGKRVIEGEIHEKKQAQQIYDDAKAQGLAASIVKQYRPNLFTTDVANIMPNEKITVEITYQQTLSYDAGHIDFRLPLAIKSRYMQQQLLVGSDVSGSETSSLQATDLPTSTVSDQQKRSINVQIEAGFELSELVSLYHDVNIQETGVFQTIKLADTTLYDANDFVLRWYPIQGKEPRAAMFSEKLNGEEYVLMMLLPPKNTQKNTQKITQKREVVFIIDTSGSMQGAAMDTAKDALLFGLTQISSQDKFNVIEFNSNATQVFAQSRIASADNLDEAVDFIVGLQSNGGTNMGPALALSMQDEVDEHYLKQIVFITDGSVGNEAQLFKQIDQNIGQARLFTVAIGQAPNNYFMSKAALIGKGTYSNISNLDDVDFEMNELFVKLSSPALTDVAIEWGHDVEQSPRVIPDLYSDQPIIVTAKMSAFNTNIGLSGFVDKSTWSQSFDLNNDGQSTGIAKLWARNQIADLTDDYMLGASNDSDWLQEQITQIALQYHLISEFTSLVAVDKTPDMSRLVQIQARAMEQAQVLAQVNYPQGSLGWKWKMLMGLMLISMALSIKRKPA
ncbi:MAG: marine proteobacterial sortase target protein [Proteobacteria bacterium]|nr:marine proteobacterial sortase target protein [Pseudomonadota bacterium]